MKWSILAVVLLIGCREETDIHIISSVDLADERGCEISCNYIPVPIGKVVIVQRHCRYGKQTVLVRHQEYYFRYGDGALEKNSRVTVIQQLSECK